eukprot:gene9845-3197_t
MAEAPPADGPVVEVKDEGVPAGGGWRRSARRGGKGVGVAAAK